MILSASLYMVILYYFIAPFGHEVITVWRLLEIHIYACESRCVYLKTVMVTLLMCDHTLEHTTIFAEATGVRSPLGKCREQTLWIMPAGEPDRRRTLSHRQHHVTCCVSPLCFSLFLCFIAIIQNMSPLCRSLQSFSTCICRQMGTRKSKHFY